MLSLTDWIVPTQDLQREVHSLARAKGFWDSPRSFAHCVALVHSELSEALQADRQGDIDKIEEELADTVIRIFDLAENMALDLGTAIIRKHRKNRNRPRLHGKRY